MENELVLVAFGVVALGVVFPTLIFTRRSERLFPILFNSVFSFLVFGFIAAVLVKMSAAEGFDMAESIWKSKTPLPLIVFGWIVCIWVQIADYIKSQA